MNLMDELWHKLKVITGACASNVQLNDLKDYLKKGEQVAVAAALLETDSGKVQKLKSGAEGPWLCQCRRSRTSLVIPV